MKYISILIGKITYRLCKMMGRGSTFPGTVANKIDKNIIKKFKVPEKVIIVTGSSGKGSTTRIIANGFRYCGFKVAHNEEGGNLPDGVVTTLLRNSSLSGKIKADVVVLEMDERYVKFVTPYIKTSDIVITNVTRDQPPRQRHFQFIIHEITKGLDKDAHLYLNANDPVMQRFVANKKDITYYGIDKLTTSYTKNLFSVLNNSRCIKCNSLLVYDYYHIEDIGSYKCSKCDFKMPNPKYSITAFKGNEITLDKKHKATLNNDMLYNLYNTLAAYSVLCEYGLDKEKICESISNLNKDNKIYNKYKVKNRDVFVLNNKCENAATYNQSMLYTYNDKRDKTVVLGWQEISRRYLYDDTSWLYDIEFELLKENTNTFIVAGPQRYELAVRLKYAGIDEKKIKIHKDLYDAKKDINKSKGPIYAVLNFDYLNDFNTVMEGLK